MRYFQRRKIVLSLKIICLMKKICSCAYLIYVKKYTLYNIRYYIIFYYTIKYNIRFFACVCVYAHNIIKGRYTYCYGYSYYTFIRVLYNRGNNGILLPNTEILQLPDPRVSSGTAIVLPEYQVN